MMRITFLGSGTSHGVPVIGCHCKICSSNDKHDKRLRSSCLVEKDGVNLLIDAGPDFRYQMLKYSVNRLDAVLLTHEHRDHIAGLDDVRAFNYLSGKAMPVYAEERVIGSVHQIFHYAFEDLPFSGLPQFDMKKVNGDAFRVGPVEVEPIRVMHHLLPILAYRIGNFGYITDANYLSEESVERFRGCSVLVVNGLMQNRHISHFSLDEAISLIQRADAGLGVITHISHGLGLHGEVSRSLPPNIILAYDGLQLEVN